MANSFDVGAPPSRIFNRTHLGALRRSAVVGAAGLVVGLGLMCSSAPAAKTETRAAPVEAPQWTRSVDIDGKGLPAMRRKALCDID